MTNQEEINSLFAFERKKHFDFFLPFYREKNWLVAQDNIDSKQKNEWDVRAEVFAGTFRTIDEKALRKEYNSFLVEIVQDMKSGGLGWYFGEKDWILYGSWNDIESIYPTSLYLVDTKRLKEYIESLEGVVKTCISKKGWGITWSILLEWNELIDKDIVKKMI